MTAMRHAVDLGLNNDRVIVSCLNKAHVSSLISQDYCHCTVHCTALYTTLY